MSITSVLFFPIFIVLTIGFSLASILAAFLDSSGNRAHRVGAAWATCLLFFSGVRARITYLETLPRGEAYIFAANHQSAFDILALLSKLKVQFRWLAKETGSSAWKAGRGYRKRSGGWRRKYRPHRGVRVPGR